MFFSGTPFSAATRRALSGWPLTRAVSRQNRVLRSAGTSCPWVSLPMPTRAYPIFRSPPPSAANAAPPPALGQAAASTPDAPARPTPCTKRRRVVPARRRLSRLSNNIGQAWRAGKLAVNTGSEPVVEADRDGGAERRRRRATHHGRVEVARRAIDDQGRAERGAHDPGSAPPVAGQALAEADGAVGPRIQVEPARHLQRGGAADRHDQRGQHVRETNRLLARICVGRDGVAVGDREAEPVEAPQPQRGGQGQAGGAEPLQARADAQTHGQVVGDVGAGGAKVADRAQPVARRGDRDRRQLDAEHERAREVPLDPRLAQGPPAVAGEAQEGAGHDLDAGHVARRRGREDRGRGWARHRGRLRARGGRVDRPRGPRRQRHEGREQRAGGHDHDPRPQSTTLTDSSSWAWRSQARTRSPGGRGSTWWVGTPPAAASLSSSGWLDRRSGARSERAALSATRGRAGASRLGSGAPAASASRPGSRQQVRSAAASMRPPRLGMPKRAASVAAIDTCSRGVDTTTPRRTKGPATIAGTRKPSWRK